MSCDYEESLSEITLTPENVELVNANVAQGTKDNLVDGEFDVMVKMTNGGDGGSGMTVKFNMDQINCINQIE